MPDKPDYLASDDPVEVPAGSVTVGERFVRDGLLRTVTVREKPSPDRVWLYTEGQTIPAMYHPMVLVQIDPDDYERRRAAVSKGAAPKGWQPDTCPGGCGSPRMPASFEYSCGRNANHAEKFVQGCFTIRKLRDDLATCGRVAGAYAANIDRLRGALQDIAEAPELRCGSVIRDYHSDADFLWSDREVGLLVNAVEAVGEIAEAALEGAPDV